jgi:hypothetical protein
MILRSEGSVQQTARGKKERAAAGGPGCNRWRMVTGPSWNPLQAGSVPLAGMVRCRDG